MIYVLQGQEELFIAQKIQEIINKNAGEVIRYDGSAKDFSVYDMLDSCTSNSLFYSGCTVLVSKPYFLIGKCEDKEFSAIQEYVDNPLYDTELVFYTYENNFNSKLKAFKMVCKNAQLITFDSYDNKHFDPYARQRINQKKLNISNDAVFSLINLCKRSATLLERNLEVLSLYPEKITAEAVNSLCSFSEDIDSYEFVNALTARDVSKAITAERKLMNKQESALGVIALLANQLRFLYHIAYLQEQGMKRNEIQKITNASDYRFQKACETLQKLKMDQILALLSKLSDLDVNIRSDASIPDTIRFELFVLDLLKKGEYAGN